MLDEWPEANHQFFTWWQVFFQSHPRARPVIQIAAVDRSIGGRRRGSSAVYSGSLRHENRPCHGTDHYSKPLSSPSGIRLPTRSLRSRQEKHRSGRATAGGLGGGLLEVPPASNVLRSSSRALLRVHSAVGLSGFPAVPHAARGLPELWRGGRGGSLGRWEAPVDQSLHAVSGSLGAEAPLVDIRRGLPHFLGPSVRRRRVCGRLGPGTSHAGEDPCHWCG